MRNDKKELVDQVEETLTSLLTLDVSTLEKPAFVHDHEWPEIDQTLRETLLWVADLYERREALPSLTYSHLRNLKEVLPQVLSTFRPVFVPSADPSLPRRIADDHERKQFLAAFTTRHEQVIEVMSGPLLMLALRSPQLRAEVGLARGLVDDIAKRLTDASGQAAEQKTEFERMKAEAQQILAEIKAIGPQASISAHERSFNHIREQHEKAAGRWLKAVVVVAVLVVGIVLWLLSASAIDHSEQTFRPWVIQRMIGTGAIVSVAYYALVICLKNYRAHRHLEVVNGHRSNAVRTFQTFVQGATDDATRNVVLLEAARCVFAPASSGYSSGADDEPTPMRILEVLKLTGKPGGG